MFNGDSGEGSIRNDVSIDKSDNDGGGDGVKDNEAVDKFWVNDDSDEDGIGNDSGSSKGKGGRVGNNGAANMFDKPACNQQTNRQEDWSQARDDIML